jgi:hypothetical protein
MKKLKLELDNLTVESFDTTGVQKPRGTVVGEQCTCWTNCDTCPGCPTCDATCAYTCDDATCPNCPTCAASCNGTCNEYTCYGTCAGEYTCDFTCEDSCRVRLCYNSYDYRVCYVEY